MAAGKGVGFHWSHNLSLCGSQTPVLLQFKNFVFWLLDDLTVKELRWSFSDAAHHKLTIPVEVDGFGDSHFPVITNKLVLQTLYYISGYLLKAMSKHAEQSSNGVGKKACLLAFVRNNETTCAEAEKDVLPVRLVKVRSSGDLRYSSKVILDLTLTHASL